MEIRTEYGIWLTQTQFKLNSGKILRIVTYECVLSEVRSLFPLECYVLLEGCRVINYVRASKSIE